MHLQHPARCLVRSARRNQTLLLLIAASLWITAACLPQPGTLIDTGAPGEAPTDAAGNDALPGAGGPATPPDDGGPTLAQLQVFPPDNPWNTDISEYPVHPNSQNYLATIGLDTGLHPDFGTIWEGAPIGIPFVVVNDLRPGLPVTFDYADESDPGPYPIPSNAPIEGGPDSEGDRHIIVVDVGQRKLYELFYAFPIYGDDVSRIAGDGQAPRLPSGLDAVQRNIVGWTAGSGAIFDLTSNELRPAGWTSADAAGLPIFPGLVRYDEVVEGGEINHALRFTVSRTQRAYISPARHWASNSTDPNRPPMGLRVRLKADVDISGYSPNVQVILRALKRYGMFVADNGSNWYISGAPDSRWDDGELHELGNIRGRDFEVVYTGEAVTP